jgi:hypothetical protein
MLSQQYQWERQKMVYRRGLSARLQQNAIGPSHNRIGMQIQLASIGWIILMRSLDCEFLGVPDLY